MRQQINLFTPQFRKQVVLLSANVMAIGASAALALTLIVSLVMQISVSGLQPQADASKRALDAAQAKLAQLAIDHDPATQAKLLDEDIARVEKAVQDKRELVDVLKNGDLGDTQGYSEYLRALARQIVDGVWIRGFDIASAGRHFTVDGSTLRADLIPQYIKRLSNEKALQGRQFAMLTLQAPKPTAADAKTGDSADTGKTEDKTKAAKPYLDFHLSSELAKPKDGSTSANAGALDRYVEYAKAVNDVRREAQ